MKNEVWTRLFGFEVNREMKQMILEEVRSTGEPIEQVVARYSMPEMAILDEDGKFLHRGKRITGAEWERINPLGKFGKIVIIGTKKMVQIHRSLCTPETISAEGNNQ